MKGKVNVEDGNQKVGLLPGQQACCSEQKISVKEVNYRDFIGWKMESSFLERCLWKIS